jgi:cytochrome P450
MSTPDMFKLLFDPSFRQDPHPHLKRMREAGALQQSASTGLWFAFGHAACVTLARSPKLGRDMAFWEHPGNTWRDENAHVNPLAHELNAALHPQMFHNNPPDHTRQRRVFQHAFVPAAIRQMEAVVAARADALIAALPDGELELMEAFAAPLPVAVICGLFEVPDADYDRLRTWSDAIAQTVELTITPEQQRAALEAKHEFDAYLGDLVEARRARPGDGLIDHVIAAQEVEGALSREELLTNLTSMLVAGHETTTNLIGSGLLSLLRHPAQLERLREDPSLIESAVEEMLRFEPPANTSLRVALDRVEVAGQVLEPGAMCILMIAAANRDPEVFDAPDSFDIGRSDNPHQSFGGGPHHCIGSMLARLEARIALRALLERYGQLELAGDAVWMDRINIRGLSSLPLRARA